MKYLRALFLAMMVPVALAYGPITSAPTATNSVQIVLVTRGTPTSTEVQAGASQTNGGWEWVGLGEGDRVEVDADWVQEEDNLRMLFDEILAVSDHNATVAKGNLEIALPEADFRSRMIDLLAEPFVAKRERTLKTFLADLEKAYESRLRECPYKACPVENCVYPKFGNRTDALLQGSCIGERNLVRYRILKADLDMVVAEMKERLGADVLIPFGPGSRMAGDWTCKGGRAGSFGCPTMTVQGVTTTMTNTIIRSFWGVWGMASYSWIHPQTFEGTQTLSADHPVITGTSERGPDDNQVEQDPPPYHGWTTCFGCA